MCMTFYPEMKYYFCYFIPKETFDEKPNVFSLFTDELLPTD